MKKNIGKMGFSLLELILVLGVGTMIAFVKFQDMRNEQDQVMASAVGQQIKQIGDAVNGYINIRYDKLSTLVNAAGSGIDPGPRVCTTSGCEITYQTLINEGLLPSTYTGVNAIRSSYKIYLRRDGTSPNYVINGLITTTSPWKDGSSIRYDLLGSAMQIAGVDSGVTKTTSNAFGYGGQWTETSTTFSGINAAGLLAYRVGYNSALYSVYLRRDGTLPMTGNLNMGANDINNAKNITASGTGNFGSDITSGGTVTAAGEVVAHNGNGDTISMGGDAAGGVNSDYEIRLGTAKQLTIFSPLAANYTTVLQVNRNLKVDQRIGNMGLDPNDLPTGWGGGVRTFDIFAGGTIAIKRLGASSNDDWGFVAGSNGDVIASNSITSKGVINATGNITSGNNISATGEISSNKRLTTNEYLQINGVVSAGAACTPNGVQGRTSDGLIISCVNGVWSKNKFTYSTYTVAFSSATAGASSTNYQRSAMGNHLACFLTGDQHHNDTQKHVYISVAGTSWTLEQRVTLWPAGISTWAYATCID